MSVGENPPTKKELRKKNKPLFTQYLMGVMSGSMLGFAMATYVSTSLWLNLGMILVIAGIALTYELLA